MNTYRVTYTSAGDETGNANITDRSESAARKAFKASYKAIGHPIPDITGIELIREGVGATKQQERDTLAVIMQMVEELGPDSYLKTAFAGCFEDAAGNIEDDFAFSMKDRYESAKKDSEHFQSAANHFSAEYDKAREEIERLKAENAALAARIPAEDDLADCIALTEASADEYEHRTETAAARIVELASDPSDPDFRQAVEDHRNSKYGLDHANALRDRLYNILTAGA